MMSFLQITLFYYYLVLLMLVKVVIRYDAPSCLMMIELNVLYDHTDVIFANYLVLLLPCIVDVS
jgi:hypothetical protein